MRPRAAGRSPRPRRAVAAGPRAARLRRPHDRLEAHRGGQLLPLLRTGRTPRPNADDMRAPTSRRAAVAAGALSRGQVHDLLAAAERLGVHPYGLCCVLALNGLRIGEATGLNVDDLDYDGLFPVLRFTRKGGRAGRAVLARPTEAAITACIADRTSGTAIPQPGRPADRPTRRPTHPRPRRRRPARPASASRPTCSVTAGRPWPSTPASPTTRSNTTAAGPTPEWSPTTPTAATKPCGPRPTASLPTSSAPPDPREIAAPIRRHGPDAARR